MNIFDVFNACLKEKPNVPQEEIEKLPPFLFRRWLGKDQRTIMTSNFFNVLSDVPIEAQYDAINAKFGGKIKYIQFPKSKKDEDIWVDRVSKHYNISKDKARMYMEYLSEDDLRSIQEELEDLLPKNNEKPKSNKKGKK